MKALIRRYSTICLLAVAVLAGADPVDRSFWASGYSCV
jgi:hypothetical protein